MKVQILLAIYNPDINYLTSQLISLNKQSYKDIEVVCCDDCSDNHEAIYNICNSTLTDIKWSYTRNITNLGCNKTFEKLVKDSSAHYLAFCDQDDIWHGDKIKCLYETIESTGATLAYSDLQIINREGDIIAKSIRKVRKRLTHKSGDNLWLHFLRMNSITGCTMLIRSEIAKAAVPFPPEKIYVWDQWLAIWSAHQGIIAYCAKPLMNYRVHNRNLIGIKKLVDINDKTTYVKIRIDSEINSISFAINRLDLNKSEKLTAIKALEFVKNRKAFILDPFGNTFRRFILASFRDPLLLFFEIGLALSPDNGSKIIKFVRRSLY